MNDPANAWISVGQSKTGMHFYSISISSAFPSHQNFKKLTSSTALAYSYDFSLLCDLITRKVKYNLFRW